MDHLLSASDLTIHLDNQALYNICQDNLQVEQPNYYNTNEIIAQCVSSFTASLRFKGSMSTMINESLSNLVPYPRLKFILPSMAPLIPADEVYKRSFSVEDITNLCFDPSTTLASCDPRKNKNMSCLLMYKGDVHQKEVTESISSLKARSTVNFVDWVHTGFKVSIVDEKPKVNFTSAIAKTQRSCCSF